MTAHAIVNVGASTAVGRDAWSTAAAIRAGVSGFGEYPAAFDSVGEPIIVARAPWLGPKVPMLRRLASLLLPVIEEALRPVAQEPPLRCAVLLGLPPQRPGLPDELDRALVSLVRDRYRRWVHDVSCIREGHTSALSAIGVATAALESGHFDACVVAGVDSYVDAETLAWLEGEDRLHGAGPLNNAWGFIPGEGAGALLLVAQGAMRERGIEPLATLLGRGAGFERKYLGSGLVCIGEGLTEALNGALTSLPRGQRVADIYCDLNGEPFRADEYGFSALRTREHFVAPGDFVAPADCWGDVGAAGGVLHAAMAAIALNKRYAKGPIALVYGSADGGARAAALIAGAEG
jgi:3-oxoacyl-[acyl-carrier-protein] synthase I